MNVVGAESAGVDGTLGSWLLQLLGVDDLEMGRAVQGSVEFDVLFDIQFPADLSVAGERIGMLERLGCIALAQVVESAADGLVGCLDGGRIDYFHLEQGEE